MKRLDFVMLLLLSVLWSSSFLFIRIASPVLGPVLLVELRVGIAAIILFVVVWISRQHDSRWRQQWRQYAVLGATNAALPFTLIATAELHLTASLAAILNATTPLFTAVVAAFWLKQPLTLTKIAGLALGIAGVAILVGWNAQPLTGVFLLSIGASLLGAISYAIAGVYAKRAFAGTAPMHLAYGQQAAATILLAPFAVVARPQGHVTLLVGSAVAALAIACTALAYLVYFRLIQQVGPTNTLLVTFLIPVFGLLWGVLFLQERVAMTTLLGMVCILASIGFVTNLHMGTWLKRFSPAHARQ